MYFPAISPILSDRVTNVFPVYQLMDLFVPWKNFPLTMQEYVAVLLLDNYLCLMQIPIINQTTFMKSFEEYRYI